LDFLSFKISAYQLWNVEQDQQSIKYMSVIEKVVVIVMVTTLG